MSWLFALCACMSIVAVALICVFLFANGIPAIKEIGAVQFLFGTDWSPKNQPASYGILPMIIGSFVRHRGRGCHRSADWPAHGDLSVPFLSGKAA